MLKVGSTVEATTCGVKHSRILQSEGSATLLGTVSFRKIRPDGIFYLSHKEVKLDGML